MNGQSHVWTARNQNDNPISPYPEQAKETPRVIRNRSHMRNQCLVAIGA